MTRGLIVITLFLDIFLVEMLGNVALFASHKIKDYLGTSHKIKDYFWLQRSCSAGNER